MTATTGPTLTNDERIQCLEWLDDGWDERAPDLREYLLKQWAHPGLTPQRRDEACALYADSRMREYDARHGITDHGTEYPGLTCAEAQVASAGHFDDLAREALHLIMHGEGEES